MRSALLFLAVFATISAEVVAIDALENALYETSETCPTCSGRGLLSRFDARRAQKRMAAN